MSACLRLITIVVFLNLSKEQPAMFLEPREVLCYSHILPFLERSLAGFKKFLHFNLYRILIFLQASGKIFFSSVYFMFHVVRTF